VDVPLTIGEFSKMTYLGVKALRHYHEIGLLEPAAVDPASGYRLYSAAQVPTAQAIRRFRDLDMPLEEIGAVLAAPDEAARNDAIVAHLRRMQGQLARTQATVASLQALLEDTPRPVPVELRTLAATPALAIADVVGFDDCSAWLDAALAELHELVELHELAEGPEVTRAGPDGALYSEELFQRGTGQVVAFVPLARPATASGRAAARELAPGRVAVMVHTGAFADVDQTYGALGTVVAERGIGVAGPIREHYLDDGRTEVCWPVAPAGATAGADDGRRDVWTTDR
jgi:DNA-binding transcriptional MerR regulator